MPGARTLVVIGGGVIGLAIAAAAAAAGWRVTLLEREHQLAAGASSASFGWVNAWAKSPQSYAALNREGIAAHAAGSAAAPAEHRWFHALPARLGDGSLYTEGGIADVGAFARAHQALLADRGAEVRLGAEVTSLDGHGRVRLADAGVLAPDRVVLAAGAGAARLLPPGAAAQALGNGRGAAGFVARVRAPAHARSELLCSDELNVGPAGADHLLMQSVAIEHRLDRAGVEPTPASVAAALTQRARVHGLDIDPADIRDVRAAVRPVPADGLPAIGWVTPSVYLVVTHSGVTLAPALGPRVSAELDGAADAALAPFRPDRPIPEETAHAR